MARTNMVPTRTIADTMIPQFILGGLLLYFGSNALALMARALSLLSLMP